MKKYISYIMLALMGLAVFSGCKKGCTDPSATNFDEDARNDDGTCEYEMYGDVTLKIDHKSGSDDFAFDQEYTTQDGRKFTFTEARMYVSNFALENASGAMEKFDDSYMILEPGETDYPLGSAFADGYVGFEFIVGIDSATNHLDPSTYPADHPLAPQSPSMHWAWNSGYIFIMIEGTRDTTTDMTGTATDGTWYFHSGMDALRRDLSFDKTFEVNENGYVLNGTLDWRELLNNIDLETEHSTHTMDNMPLARKVADNVPNAFDFGQ